jgi:hypothetical protein
MFIFFPRSPNKTIMQIFSSSLLSTISGKKDKIPETLGYFA